MEPKIFISVLSDGCGILKILKCLKYLYVRWLRPPPGGAPEHINVISSIFFQNNFYLSKKPPTSTSCRSNSMQGYAPNCSKAGILISSMNMAIFSLGLAPHTTLPFLFSLASMANWVYCGLVWAEKFKKIELIPFSDLSPYSSLYNTTDLPTPVLPVTNIG